jgi:ferredoxin
LTYINVILLRLYARLERPLLRLNYAVVRIRWAHWAPLRWLIGRLLLEPLSAMGAVGQPVTPAEAAELVRDAEREGALAIGPCGCRSVHRGCAHPLRTDTAIFAGASAWQAAFPVEYERTTGADVLSTMEACRRLGMIQVLYRTGMRVPVEEAQADGGGAHAQADLGRSQGMSAYALCNCCSDGCLPLLNRRFYPGYRFLEGAYVAVVDAGRCNGCGDCVKLCPFDARRPADAGIVAGCLGCGLCAERCPQGAVDMAIRADSPLRSRQ